MKELRETLRREYPNVQLHASVFVNARTFASKIGQDWEAWCQEGLLDVVSPMDYTFFPGEYVKLLAQQKEQCQGVTMWPIFGPTLWPDDGHLEMRAAEVLRETREAGLPGFGWFCFDDRTVRLIEALKQGPLSCEE